MACLGNSVEGCLPLRDQVDAACRSVGRDPAKIERTLAVLVGFTGAVGREAGDESDPESEPIPGDDPEALAVILRDFADAGVAHIQLVLDPITVDVISRLEPMLAILDGPTR